MKNNNNAKLQLKQAGYTHIKTSGHWISRKGKPIPVLLLQKPDGTGITICGDRRQLGRQLKELARWASAEQSAAAIREASKATDKILDWYGTQPAAIAALSQDDEDLLAEIEQLAEPTYPEYAAAKSAAHDCLWDEAKRRGLVA